MGYSPLGGGKQWDTTERLTLSPSALSEGLVSTSVTTLIHNRDTRV